jgi:hypothetical protein
MIVAKTGGISRNDTLQPGRRIWGFTRVLRSPSDFVLRAPKQMAGAFEADLCVAVLEAWKTNL